MKKKLLFRLSLACNIIKSIIAFVLSEDLTYGQKYDNSNTKIECK